MKKRKFRLWLALLAPGVLLYLIIGAIVPFSRYREISPQTKADFHPEDILKERKSPDRAMLLETNQSAWEERIRLFACAKERIILTTFDMREGESTRDLLAVLLQRAQEGVCVRMIVDGFSAAVHMRKNPLFLAFSSHPNVELKIYNPVNLLTPWKTQGRMHDKYVIVDDKGVILGGRNMFDYFIGSYDTEHPSYDREVLIYNEKWRQASEEEYVADSVLYDLEKYFENMWSQKSCRLYYDDEALAEKKKVAAERKALSERYEKLRVQWPTLFEEIAYEEITFPTQGVSLLSNPIGIYGKEPILFYQLTELIMHAKERVIIHTPYLVCNDYMYERLGAVRETVPDMMLMMNSVANGDNFMASGDYLYQKKNVVKSGLPVYEYDGGRSYHGKSVVMDQNISIVGSLNMDLRSVYGDTEVMLAINSRELTKQLSASMEDFHADCRRIIDEKTYEEGSRPVIPRKTSPVRNVLMRLVGFIMQGFRYLL